jgi:hypothetical protein
LKLSSSRILGEVDTAKVVDLDGDRVVMDEMDMVIPDSERGR